LAWGMHHAYRHAATLLVEQLSGSPCARRLDSITL
jgi:hypothetical protein